MKENSKKQKGITLIALVITIIVLLILAMVSIKLVWDGGIIAHAQNAVNAYNEAQTNELAQLTQLEEELKQYGGANSNNNSSGNWWELRSGEAEEFERNGSQVGKGLIATTQNLGSDTGVGVAFYDMGHGDPIDGILIMTDKGEFATDGFICHIGDKTIDAYDGEYERGKWYRLKGGSGPLLPYEGTSPISIEDFADGTIYCRSYLERIISSFNH